jgi:hypothetical protein
MNVRENPITRLHVAFELRSQAVAHGAMGAITADQARDLQYLLSPVCVPRRDRHLVGVGDKPQQFDLPLHLYAA